MDEQQAKALGRLLRDTREQQELSTHQLSKIVGINQATIVRLEQGSFVNPDPDKLRAVAEALALNLTDILVMAGYPITTELPSMGPYLRTKYRDLPAGAASQIQQEVVRMLRSYGVEPNGGPLDGEDEQTDDT